MSFVLPLLSALLVQVAPPTADDAALLTGLVAAAAAEAGADVVTREDLRKALAVEGDKQAMGCDENESCLAELAQALNARLVVFGTVSVLGDELVLQLSAFDARTATSAGRATARGADLAALSRAAEDKARALITTALEKSEGPVRVMVLDLEAKGGTSEVKSDDGSNVLWGAVGMGVGVATLAGATVLHVLGRTGHDATSQNLALSASAANDAYARDEAFMATALVGYAAGVTVFAVGAGFALVGVALADAP
jgi:hypothetical protein